VVERQERLEEAIEVIRELWEGNLISHRGEHFTVENARIYSLPDELPPLVRWLARAPSNLPPV
jgi:coenzyme F420-dependent glucose-6-phosphate dehydrogenase